MEPVAETIAMRCGDELPQDLEAYLKRVLQAEGIYRVQQFPGGYSNLTYRIEIGAQCFVLRRPPRGVKAKTAHDMGREFFVLDRLQRVLPEVPAPLHFCEDEQVIGSPFYVMSYRPGLILRKEWPPTLTLTHAQQTQQMRQVIALQARLHSLDYRALDLATLGQGEGYAQRQVHGWVKRYRAARTEDAPLFEQVMAWLETEVASLPASTPCLIHNDFKLDNIVFDPDDPTQIRGLLDWEMATIGDPLMDLGNSLAYWVEAQDSPSRQAFRTLPSHHPGYPTRVVQLEWYTELTGRKVERWDFYETFGLFRLAVIAQQIYHRYRLGHSQDQRFALLIHGVRALEQACIDVIKT